VSAPVTVVVEKAAPAKNQVPSVSITTPINNDPLEVPASIMLTAAASDPDGSIVRVEYHYIDIKLGESYTPPYSLSFQPDTAGTFEIKATAYDNLNASTSSAPIIVSFKHKKIYADLVKLYPSPNQGAFTVDLNPLAELSDSVRLTILCFDGKTVYSDLLEAGESSININISDALPDIYILNIAGISGIQTTKRFIKN